MPRKNSREKVKAFIRDFKSKSACLDCGTKEELTFDHRPEEIKRFDLAQAPKYSITLVLQEIAKCQIVCIPCHRTREDIRLEDPSFQDNKKMMEAVCKVFRLFSILAGSEAAYRECRDIAREKEKKKRDRLRYKRSKKNRTKELENSESSPLLPLDLQPSNQNSSPPTLGEHAAVPTFESLSGKGRYKPPFDGFLPGSEPILDN